MPKVRIPLVGSLTARGWAKSLGTSAKDQQYINALFEYSANAQTESKSVYVSKRAGSATSTTIDSDIVITKHSSSYFSTQFVANSDTFYDTAGTNLGTLTAPISAVNNYVLTDSVPSANTNLGILAWVTEDGEGWYLYSNAITNNFPTFTGDTHTNTVIDNITSTTGIYVGQAISGSGITAGTRVATVTSATAITTTLATTATAAGVTITKEAISQIIDADFPVLDLIDGADFDGTNDYMTRGAGLTAAADSKKGIFSAWARLDGGDGTRMELLYADGAVGGGADQKLTINRSTGNTFAITLENAAGTGVLILTSAGTYLSSASWIHILASWDLATETAHLYINDVSDVGTSLETNDTIDYTAADWSIGAECDGTTKLNGCLAEVYFAPGQYLDFSITANRRKFISGSVSWVDLGDTGSLPTGTAPLVYQHLDDAEAVANFATNRGTGGNFTITGTLETASTDPPQAGAAISMAALDGRFFVVTGGALVYQSALNDPSSWSASEFIAADYSGDGAAFMFRHGSYLIVAGSLSTLQYFYNAGNPFGSVLSKADNLLVTGLQLQSGPIELVGAKYCIAYSAGSESPGGQAGLYTLSGTNTFTRVSDDITSSFLESVTRVGTAYNANKSLLVLHSSDDATFLTFDPSTNLSQPMSLSAAITSANGTYFTKSGSSTLFTWASDNTWTDSSSSFTLTIQMEPQYLNEGLPFTVDDLRLVADTESTGTTACLVSGDDYANFTDVGDFDMTVPIKRVPGAGYFQTSVAFKLTNSANANFRGQALDVWFTPCT